MYLWRNHVYTNDQEYDPAANGCMQYTKPFDWLGLKAELQASRGIANYL